MKRCRAVCFCLLSLAATSLPLAAAENVSVLAPFLAAFPLALFAMSLGYRRMEREPSAYRSVALWLLATAFACVVTLGQSFAATGTAELATAHKLRTLLYLAGRVPLYYMGMALLRAWLWREDAPAERGTWFDRLPAWAFALALLVCWLPYAFLLYPGTVSSDSITMLSEIVGAKPMSNGNPIFQTLLLNLCVKLGFGSGDRAIALYCGVQALLMAWLLGCTVKRTRAVKRRLAAGALVFYALCPIFPTFAFCVGKDTSFAMAVLWLMLEALRSLTEERYRGWWRLALAGALCVLLRNPGVYLAALTLLGLLIFALRRRKGWLAPAVGLGVVAAAWLAINLLIVPTLAIEPTPETEEWSVPLQQVARVVASQTVTDDEREAISAVLDFEQLHTEYNGELSDPVKNLWKADATAAQKRAFFGVWLRLLWEHPATCLSATFHNSYGYLCPGYMSTVKPTLILGATSRTTAIDGKFDYSINPRAEKLKRTLVSLVNDVPPLRLLVSGGVYGWLALFGFIGALSGDRKRLALCLTPALFTLLGCLFSAVNGYIRYTMPLYFAAPLCLAAVSLARGRKEHNA